MTSPVLIDLMGYTFESQLAKIQNRSELIITPCPIQEQKSYAFKNQIVFIKLTSVDSFSRLFKTYD
jgi:hypothetical protein